MKLLVRCSCGEDIGTVDFDPSDPIPSADIPFDVAEQTGNHIKRGHQTNLLEI